MSQTDLKQEIPSENSKKSDFWMLFFIVLLLVIGIIVGIIGLVLDNFLLLLCSIPMLLSFFILGGIFIYKKVKEEQARITTVVEDETDEYYETSLNFSEEVILNMEENPYKKEAIKTLAIILLSILVPFGLEFLLRKIDVEVLGLKLSDICAGLMLILGFYSVIRGWEHLANFFEFRRAKKVALYKQNGEKKPFLFPRINFLSFLFFLFAVMMLFPAVGEINTLNDYRENGVAVHAVSYRVDTLDEDFDVYFRYNYRGKTYSHAERNYSGGKKTGEEVQGYIKPQKPGVLYLPSNSFFAVVHFMLIGAFYFLWMGNHWRKSLIAICLFIDGVIAMLFGFSADVAGNKVWGAIVLLCALFFWLKRKRKSA